MAQSGQDAGDGDTGGEVRHHAVKAHFRIGNVQAGQLADNAQQPGDEDAPEDAALDFFHHQNRGDQHTDDGQQNGDALSAEGLSVVAEAVYGHQCGGVHHQLAVLQADEGDEQSDAGGDGALEGHGDGVEDGFPHVGQGERDEDQALHKHGGQRHLPGIAHAAYYGISKVGVQSHAGGKDEGIVGQQSHQDGCDQGGKTGGGEYGALVHTRGAEDVRVDGQDVGHGHEGGDTCHDLSFDVCFVLA